jgi:hypothetical protein
MQTNLAVVSAPAAEYLPVSADSRSELDALIKQIQRSHDGVERTCYEGVWHACQAGDALRFVKERIPHGQWRQWLGESFPTISVRTCERYMEVSAVLRSLPGYVAGQSRYLVSKTTRASQLAVIRSNGLSSLRKVLALNQVSDQQSEAERQSLPPLAPEPAPLQTSAVDDDWQTPLEIIRAAMELFGGIDLDPCGVTDPARHLPVVKTITPEDDSLSSSISWEGRVFVHPPASNVSPFVDRTAAAVASGEADEALLLIPAETDAAHMGVLQPFAKGFLRSRPTFSVSSDEFAQPSWPYVLVFLSRFDERIDAFAVACGHLADIYRPYRF